MSESEMQPKFMTMRKATEVATNFFARFLSAQVDDCRRGNFGCWVVDWNTIGIRRIPLRASFSLRTAQFIPPKGSDYRDCTNRDRLN